MRGDPNRLAQVVGNLLSNAIKYSPDGGTVAARAERSDDGGAGRVRDEGLGIPEDQQEPIFTKFFRGDAGATGSPAPASASRSRARSSRRMAAASASTATPARARLLARAAREPREAITNNLKETPR